MYRFSDGRPGFLKFSTLLMFSNVNVYSWCEKFDVCKIQLILILDTSKVNKFSINSYIIKLHNSNVWIWSVIKHRKFNVTNSNFSFITNNSDNNPTYMNALNNNLERWPNQITHIRMHVIIDKGETALIIENWDNYQIIVNIDIHALLLSKSRQSSSFESNKIPCLSVGYFDSINSSSKTMDGRKIRNGFTIHVETARRNTKKKSGTAALVIPFETGQKARCLVAH